MLLRDPVVLREERNRPHAPRQDRLIPVILLLAAAGVGAAIGFDAALSVKIAAPLLFLLLLAVGATISAPVSPPVRQLRYLVAALCLASALWPPYAVFSFGALPSLDPKKLLAAILLAMMCLVAAISPVILGRVSQRMRVAGLPGAAIVAFMLWRLITAVMADNISASLVQFMWEFVTFYLVFFSTLACVEKCDDVRWMMGALTWCALAVGVLAAYERVTQANPLLAVLPVSPDYAATQLSNLAMRMREGVMRVQGTFEHPMALAEFLTFVYPVVFVYTLMFTRGALRLLGWLCMAGCVAGIYFSGTRSAMLVSAAIAVSGGCLYLLRAACKGSTLHKLMSVFGVVAIGLIVLAVAGAAMQLIQGRSAAERGSNEARVEQLERGLPRIQDAPLLGAGVGQGNAEIGFDFLNGRLAVDNYYLTLALDSGLPGTLFFFAFCFGFGLEGVRLGVKGRGAPAAMAGALGLSIISMGVVKVVLSIHYNLIFIYLAAALLVVLREQITGAAAGKDIR